MLLARLLSKIFKKNGIILIDSYGQKYICGKPNLDKPLTVKLLKKDLNWKPKVSFKTGVSIILKNIDYWKNAPLWDKNKIKKETKLWFKYLK